MLKRSHFILYVRDQAQSARFFRAVLGVPRA
jgi:catechol 2,3-dioxygenase-like lactoylglutathione lyase family enzyme